MSLKRFKADMHIHTCLSPCADLSMGPKGIIEKSLAKGLDIIAICDHNSAENAAVVMYLGKRKGLSVIPGIEVCSREEVHTIGLFSDLSEAFKMQTHIYSHLQGKNRPEFFGDQYIVNEHDEIIGENLRMLISATRLGIHEIVDMIHSLGGMAIASHVNRPGFGIIKQLGFIPDNLTLDAVEISYHLPLKAAREKLPGIGALPCITSSDAHNATDIGKVWTNFQMEAPDFEEFRLAIQGKKGRGIVIE